MIRVITLTPKELLEHSTDALVVSIDTTYENPPMVQYIDNAIKGYRKKYLTFTKWLRAREYGKTKAREAAMSTKSCQLLVGVPYSIPTKHEHIRSVVTVTKGMLKPTIGQWMRSMSVISRKMGSNCIMSYTIVMPQFELKQKTIVEKLSKVLNHKDDITLVFVEGE